MVSRRLKLEAMYCDQGPNLCVPLTFIRSDVSFNSFQYSLVTTSGIFIGLQVYATCVTQSPNQTLTRMLALQCSTCVTDQNFVDDESHIILTCFTTVSLALCRLRTYRIYSELMKALESPLFRRRCIHLVASGHVLMTS